MVSVNLCTSKQKMTKDELLFLPNAMELRPFFQKHAGVVAIISVCPPPLSDILECTGSRR